MPVLIPRRIEVWHARMPGARSPALAPVSVRLRRIISRNTRGLGADWNRLTFVGDHGAVDAFLDARDEARRAYTTLERALDLLTLGVMRRTRRPLEELASASVFEGQDPRALFAEQAALTAEEDCALRREVREERSARGWASGTPS